MMQDKNQEEQQQISYLFSDIELKQLALFFRNYPKELPQELEFFSDFTEKYVYSKMTIGEAESFFKDSLS